MRWRAKGTGLPCSLVQGAAQSARLADLQGARDFQNPHEHFFSHVCSFIFHFFFCFFALFLSLLHALLADGGDEGGGAVATHSRFAKHLPVDAGIGQSWLFVPPMLHLTTRRRGMRIEREAGGSQEPAPPRPPSTHAPSKGLFHASTAYQKNGSSSPSCEGKLPLRSLS